MVFKKVVPATNEPDLASLVGPFSQLFLGLCEDGRNTFPRMVWDGNDATSMQPLTSIHCWNSSNVSKHVQTVSKTFLKDRFFSGGLEPSTHMVNPFERGLDSCRLIRS